MQIINVCNGGIGVIPNPSASIPGLIEKRIPIRLHRKSGIDCENLKENAP
jgi:hypothetical protein